MDNFIPDGGSLVFTLDNEVIAPVVGWSLVEGELEPVVMVDGKRFVTAKEYEEELPEGTAKFRQAVRVPDPGPARRPVPEH